MKSTASRSIALLLVSALTSLQAVGLSTTEQPCGNQSPKGPSAPLYPCEGVNVYSAYTGNAHRDVLDISVFGSVGKMPLQFIRSSNTRLAPQSASQGRFGRDGVWTHNYQWFLRDGGTYSNGQPAMRIGYPDGSDTIFVLSSSTGRLLPQCNKWLRWPFLEAAWVDIGCDGYFGALYRRAREESAHGANTSIIIVARRMVEIAWQMLGKKRKYENRPPKAASPQRVKTKAAKTTEPPGDTKTFPARSHISLAAS